MGIGMNGGEREERNEETVVWGREKREGNVWRGM